MITPAHNREESLVRKQAERQTQAGEFAVSRSIWLATVAAFALVLALVGAPYLALARTSFYGFDPATQTYGTTLTLEHYRAFVDGSGYRAALGRSLQVSLWVTVWCFALGFPVAYVMARAGRHLRTLLFVVVVSSLTINVVVRTFAWLIILAQNGPVNNLLELGGLGPVRWLFNSTGVTIGLVHVLLPYMVLPLYSALISIPSSLEEAAMSLGAAPSVAFWRVVLPLTTPGIIAGATMVFTLAISSYVTPAVLGGGTYPVLTMLAADEILISLNFPRGSAVAIVLVLVTLICLWCGQLIAVRARIQRG